MSVQRTGLVHISSMIPFATPEKPRRPDYESAPWVTHWSRTCEHDITARLKKYASGVRAKMQCRKCGQGVGSQIAMKGVIDLWDEELEARVQSEYDAACKEWRRQADEFMQQSGERPTSWWELYNRYLRSAVWANKRELVFRRCGGLCEACGEAAAEQVHHLKYPDTFGLEPLWDLRAVCLPCHKLIHPHMR